MKRRLMCILLALMLIISMPFVAFASESDDTGSSGDVIIDDETENEGGDVDISDDGGNDNPDGSESDIQGDDEEVSTPGDGDSDNDKNTGEDTIKKVKIISISDNQTVYVGETATFTVEATGDDLHYTWEMKLTGSTYKAVGSSASYSVNVDSDKYDGAEIRCIVSNTVSSETTSAMTITVKEDAEEIKITTHPKSVSVESGKDFTLSAEGESNKGSVTYSWSYQKNGESQWRIPSESSSKTNKLTMTADPSLNGAVFRCKITGTDDDVFVYTKNATISVSMSIVILEQPGPKIVAQEGQPLNLVVTAGGENISYYWSYKDPKATDWILTGVKSNSITIDEVTAAMDGRAYRCKVYNSAGEVYTDEIKISVLSAAPRIISQSDVVQFVTVGDALSLFVKAEGKDLKYEWEYMLSDSNKWVSTKIKRSEFAEEIDDMFYNGAQFRCKITNEGGETLSQVISVTVSEAPITPCEDGAHVFTLWNVLSPATDKISGLAERTCDICGFSENNEIPAGTAADADLELLFSGEIIPSDEDNDVNDGGGIDPAMLIVAVMVLCAAGIVIILVLKKKNSESGFFDDDEEEDAPDIDDVSSEELSSDTNEFVFPGSTEFTEGNSVDGESQADKDDEMMTKVIPEIARTEFDDVSDFESTNAEVAEDIDDCESITTVIPVSEIEKMISEADNDSLSEE
ncbi:MAG: immunoglobulin domain-containing protein [Anaerofustis stercorihominis]|nr:immunoglobulin domain-containing protein [Anaerofustis stercorihominis]